MMAQELIHESSVLEEDKIVAHLVSQFTSNEMETEMRLGVGEVETRVYVNEGREPGRRWLADER